MAIRFINGRYEVEVSVRVPGLKSPKSTKRTTYTDSHGTRKSITSKSIAIKIEKNLKKELLVSGLEKIREKEVPNWEVVVEGLLGQMVNEELSPATIYNCEKALNAHVAEKWTGRKIDEITTVEIREFLISLKDKGLSNWTMIDIRKYINSVFNYALEAGFIKGNPTPKNRFKRISKEKSYLTHSQVNCLIKKSLLEGCEWYPVWALAIHTGMRNGELFALTWEQVDLENDNIRVDRSWTKKSGFKKSTKTGQNRLIPINSDLKLILKELKEERFGVSEFVLPRIPNWERGDQAKELKFFLGRHGLPQIRFHDLRATWATMLLRDGVSISRVMAMGGWTEIKTVQHYHRLSGIDVKGATDSITFLKDKPHLVSESSEKPVDKAEKSYKNSHLRLVE